jgi:hypothetical protein
VGGREDDGEISGAGALWRSTERTASDALHAHGYLSSVIVAGACDEALEQVIVPGLDYCGIR